MHIGEIYHDLKGRYLTHVCGSCAAGSRITYVLGPLNVRYRRAFVYNPQLLFRWFHFIMSLS